MTVLTLEIQDLAVNYRARQVLAGISLQKIYAGEVVALVGPNAAGKSTFLKAIAGLVPATGRVLINGENCLQSPARERAQRIGYMPQTLPGDTSLTVLEATIAALGNRDPAAGSANEFDALRVLERLGIGELALQPLMQLSGGQRQLAALAQTVVRGCPLVLLDEPVSALDLAHQWQVMNVARRLADEGHIVIVVLHDLTLAAQWADLIAILHEHQVHSFGRPCNVITECALQQVWGVRARVRSCEQGRPYVLVDGPAEPCRAEREPSILEQIP